MKSIIESNASMGNLQQILKYKNKNVIFRFLKLYSVSKEEAEVLFTETIKWLYAINLNKNLYKTDKVDFLISINDDLLMLDEMWHNFILFTKNYADFCTEYFGCFINHQPITECEYNREKQKEKIDFEKVQEERRVYFKKQYSFIHDLFGEETLIKWHKEWPIKYSIDKINKMKK